ncbi:hypothetical protein [Shinella kummerowiae]|uniref:hypothetical protein n=1 Tax=Shinella kummerowiae TaxID=417745 RepID=UPI0021B5E008|nr:hypothetical protein [Shinella kummerowiae]MCT7662922.1 hypothetical protein [Shinella kummerowiae]
MSLVERKCVFRVIQRRISQCLPDDQSIQVDCLSQALQFDGKGPLNPDIHGTDQNRLSQKNDIVVETPSIISARRWKAGILGLKRRNMAGAPGFPAKDFALFQAFEKVNKS